MVLCRRRERLSHRFIILQNTMNRGYCNAVNQGITWALEQGASYVWVCNNDIRVDPGCLMRLVESGEGHPEGGVFGPMVYSYDEPAHVTNTGYHINFWTGQMRSLIPGRDIFVESESCLEEVMTVLGCASLIRANVFHEVGLFNRCMVCTSRRQTLMSECAGEAARFFL